MLKCIYITEVESMDSWLDLFLLVFASFRLTRLIVYDTITEFIRKPFHETIVETMEDGSTETYIEVKGSGLRYWIGELLSCHWCTGIWTTVFLYGAYELVPSIAMPVIIILAIAGIASIIQHWVVKDDN
jgi:hypothetical protein